MTLKDINDTRHFKDEVLTIAKLRFLQSVEDFMRTRRYSRRAISTYLYWIKLFILFNGKQYPTLLGDEHIVRFLTFLATERNVSTGTHALALNAVVFLKTKFLGQPVGDLTGFRRSERQRKLPVVLIEDEVSVLLQAVDQRHYLKVALADKLLPALREQIGQVERFVRRDRSTDQYAGVWLSEAARKYPNAPFDLGWHYLFPASRLRVDPAGGCLRRHHFDENNLNW